MKIVLPNDFEIIHPDAARHVVFYTSVDPGSFVPPHWHDAVEIILMQEGSLIVRDPRGTRLLHAGNLYLVNPNIVHSTRCTAPNRAIVFQIPQNFIRLYLPEAKDLAFDLLTDREKKTDVSDSKNHRHPGRDAEEEKSIADTKRSQFISTLEKMQYLTDHKPDGYLLLFNSLLFDAVFQLYHNFSTQQPVQHSAKLERLIPVLSYVREHYKEPISIAEAADIAGLQPQYFCRFFKQRMGVTFLEYQNDVRLSAIYSDLIRTDDKIGDILERHGFTNYTLFRRMFRARFGCTPRDIRKQNPVHHNQQTKSN